MYLPMAGTNRGEFDWQQFSVGDRIVLRFRLPESDGIALSTPKRFSDVLGLVQENNQIAVTVQKDAAGYDRDDDAGIVTVPWIDVESAKKVPPRPKHSQVHTFDYRAAGRRNNGTLNTQVPISMLAKMASLDAAIEPTIFSAPVKYSMRDMAREAGTTVEHVFNLTRWIGSNPADADKVGYTDLDLDAVKNAVAFAAAEQIDDATMSTLLRGMGFSMERLTTRQIEAMIQHNVDVLGMGDTEARLTATAQVPHQAEKVLAMLAHVYRRHLAISTRRLTTEAITQRGLTSNDDDFPLIRAVGFADLVDFTSRTEKATAQEFTDLIHNFRDTVWDIVNKGRGRTINFIGDAVFFVADTIEEGAEIALNLAAPGALGISGQVRVGLVWGRIIATYGDAYGPTVNLASRLCAAATPGEVFIGPIATRMLGRYPEYDVMPQPKVEARGIGWVNTSRLRRANDARTAQDTSAEVSSTAARSATAGPGDQGDSTAASLLDDLTDLTGLTDTDAPPDE